MRLVIQSGQSVGLTFELNKDTIRVGRDANCDVPVSDVAVSRDHCRIQREARGWVIQDSGSRNGTLVDGERIQSQRVLNPGDVITVGKTSFRVEESLAAPAYAPPEPVDAQMPVRSTLGQRSGASTWIVLGSVLLGLLLVMALIAFFVLAPPGPSQISNLSTIPSTATSTPTLTPQPTVTLAPSSIPVTGAATSLPGNVESTATPTVTPVPTATPTRLYLEVFVSSQSNQTKFTQSDTIILRWDSAGTLRSQDLYQVQIATSSDFTESTIVWAGQTKDTQIIVPGLPQFNQRYFWRVRVVAPDASGKLIPLSPATKVYDLLWAP